MELQTKRLILRAWQENDAESLYKYAKNPNIGTISGWQPHTSVEYSREIIRTVMSADETYAVVLKETSEAIGSIGFIPPQSKHSIEMMGDESEIGYWIGEPFWGQGLIPEAVRELLRYGFEDLNLSAIWCGYFDGNEKSRRVQEKCGFIYHHSEHNKFVPLTDEIRTEHFTRILRKNWKNPQ
ncbi:MAG: GNAT family N-acetyltransferase [Prevotellaceae bacterium]|jgi:RimJ/RimL family protein N-acetyltransferase|nr:GNAT family N-acetyltransferase [Prevotellaceae bacterium]